MQRRVGVLGAGVMGRGVAEVVARAGHEVVLVDVRQSILDEARRSIWQSARLRPLQGCGDADHEVVLSRLLTSTKIDTLADCDFVVENVPEVWELKSRVYPGLEDVCRPDAVFVANTSAFPITRIASLVVDPGRVIGVHFMNPVPLKAAVELIPGHHTTAETEQVTRALLSTLDINPIKVNDSCGFVSNRVLMLTINEAAFLVHEQVSDAESVDRVFRECFGHPMGPLATADLIGIDTILHSLDVLLDHYGDPKFRPCPLLKEMVYAGRLGQKSGQGFFSHGWRPHQPQQPSAVRPHVQRKERP